MPKPEYEDPREPDEDDPEEFDGEDPEESDLERWERVWPEVAIGFGFAGTNAFFGFWDKMLSVVEATNTPPLYNRDRVLEYAAATNTPMAGAIGRYAADPFVTNLVHRSAALFEEGSPGRAFFLDMLRPAEP
ncbi:MAG: hypothetical protein IJ783_01375 [Kiritimatiellae bacterium]|nr:hypothetical protein [Kiritimatiellia bacterium]